MHDYTRKTTGKDDHLQQLRHIIRDWLESRNEVPQEIRPCWMFRDDMAVIHGIIMLQLLKKSTRSDPKDLKSFIEFSSCTITARGQGNDQSSAANFQMNSNCSPSQLQRSSP